MPDSKIEQPRPLKSLIRFAGNTRIILFNINRAVGFVDKLVGQLLDVVDRHVIIVRILLSLLSLISVQISCRGTVFVRFAALSGCD